MKRFSILLIAAMTAISAFAQEYKHSAGVITGSFNALSYKLFFTEKLAVQADLGFGVVATSGTGSFGYRWTEEFGAGTEVDYKAKLNASLWTFQLSPNVVYHLNIADKEWCRISAVLGGGISLGYAKFNSSPRVVSDKMIYNAYPTEGPSETIEFDNIYVLDKKDEEIKYSQLMEGGFQSVGVQNSNYGKFGVNAMLGIEVALKNAPITLGFDFRPGYGMLFTGHSKEYKELKEYWTKDGGQGDYKETPFVYSFFDWSISTSIRYTF
jgi:hypothetical protein